MSDQSYTTTFSVDRTPAEVFDAINNPRAWWSEEIEGTTEEIGEEFTFRVKDVHYSRITVTERVPGEKVVWRVLDTYMNFIDDQSEWKDTEIRFELSEKDGTTEVRFTHAGLVPAYECFDVCSNAWGYYIGGSLRSLITTGEGMPSSNPDGERYQVLTGPSGSGYYAASKAALESMTASLRKEVGPLGITAMVVEPGGFRTDFGGRSLQQSRETIAEYVDTAGKRRKEDETAANDQRQGDPAKAAQASSMHFAETDAWGKTSLSTAFSD